MPLVKIDMTRGRSKTEIRRIADAIQEVMVSDFAAPPADRNQIITQHDAGELIFSDAGLGLVRTEKLIFVQVFQLSRTVLQKQTLYNALMDKLVRVDSLQEGDLIVNCVRTEREDWSMGKGEAQFVLGKL